MNRNRRKYQIFSSIFSNAYFLSFLKFFPCPYLNCYACPLASFACPIGTIQHFAIIRSIPFLTIGILGMVGVLVGRMTCGWLCPFGFLQDLLARIPVPKLGIPDGLTYFRFLVLIFLVILIPLWVGEPWFSKLCPMGALQAAIPMVLFTKELWAKIGWLFYAKMSLLFFFLIWMIFSKRPFCRTICPLGTIFSLFNRFSFLQLKVDLSSCNLCGECQRICPVDIKVYEHPNSVNSLRCIRCLECTSCPHISWSFK